jgi:hypothetical protein
MDEASRRKFLARYATMALVAAMAPSDAAAAEDNDEDARKARDAIKELEKRRQLNKAVYGPPPNLPPIDGNHGPRPPAPVYGPPPRRDEPPAAPTDKVDNPK